MKNIPGPPQTRMRPPLVTFITNQNRLIYLLTFSESGTLWWQHEKWAFTQRQRDWMNSHHTGPISKCRSPRCGFIQVNDDGEDGRDNAGLCPPVSLVRLIGDPACCAVALQDHRCCSSHIWTQQFQYFHIDFDRDSSESILITVNLKSVSMVHFYLLCFGLSWLTSCTNIYVNFALFLRALYVAHTQFLYSVASRLILS